VEFLRACYRSKWQLFRDTTAQTQGYYYRAAPGAVHCPVPHNYGSHNWVSEEPVGRLGEQTPGRRLFFAGDLPIDPPCCVLLGAPDRITSGDVYADARPARTLPLGIDSRVFPLCGQPRPAYLDSRIDAGNVLLGGSAAVSVVTSVSGTGGMLLNGSAGKATYTGYRGIGGMWMRGSDDVAIQ
jgi:hypothetical protein